MMIILFMKRAISMSKQLEYYMMYQKELMKIAGQSTALYIISSGVYLVGAGSGDFILNYYINPLLQKAYTPYQFSDILVQRYSNFIQACLSITLINREFKRVAFDKKIYKIFFNALLISYIFYRFTILVHISTSEFCLILK